MHYSKFGISVNSCTSGLIAAVGAIGCAPGDEVIVPTLTMSATATSAVIFSLSAKDSVSLSDPEFNQLLHSN